jgi:hypothetical protein
MTLAQRIYAEAVAAMIAADVDGYESEPSRPPTEREIHQRIRHRRNNLKYQERHGKRK